MSQCPAIQLAAALWVSQMLRSSSQGCAECQVGVRKPYTSDSCAVAAYIVRSRKRSDLGTCASSADAEVDTAAVPALLGAPAAALQKLSAASRQVQLAALAGRRLMASLYCGSQQDGSARIAAVRLLDG